MSSVLKPHFVYVDSHTKLSGTDDNFTYAINLPDTDYDSVVVLSALIPKSYPLVGTNNTFILKELGVNTTITVPTGCYLLNTFRTVIQGLLNANSPNHWTYTMTYPNIQTSANTGRFTYNVSGNSGQPSLIFTTFLWECFGFKKNSTNTFSNNTLVSANIIKLQVEDRLLLTSNLVRSTSATGNGVLQEFNSASSPDFSSIVYQCTAPEYYSKRICNTTSSSFEFAVLTEDFTPVDFGGQNIMFTLCFYKSSPVYDTIDKVIKLIVSSQEK